MDPTEKALEFISKKGPCLPVEVSKELSTNILLASVYLSDLISRKKIKSSHLKIGGSPLYYLPSQEEQLQKFSEKLGEKHKEAYRIIKEKKIVEEKEVSPSIRVALSQINDFAKKVEVKIGEEKQSFWKWYLLKDDEVKQIIKERWQKEKLLEKEKGGKQQQEKAEREKMKAQQEQEAVQKKGGEKEEEKQGGKPEEKTDEGQRREKEENKKAKEGGEAKTGETMILEGVKKKEGETRILSPNFPLNKKEDFEPAYEQTKVKLETGLSEGSKKERKKELPEEEKKEKKAEKELTEEEKKKGEEEGEKEKSREKRENKEREKKTKKEHKGEGEEKIIQASLALVKKEDFQQSDFLKKTHSFIQLKNIQVKELEVIRKTSEANMIIELDSAIGRLIFYAKAKKKARLNEGDLSTVFFEAQTKRLPPLLLTTGKLTKKAKEKLNKEFKGLKILTIKD